WEVFIISEEDGLSLDQKRRLDVIAVDLNTTIQKAETYIVGEVVWVTVDVPSSYTQQYGNKQQVFFIDIVQPVLKKEIFNWENAVLNLPARLDYVDWSVGTLKENNAE